jgi:hypothetical protein
MEESAKVFHRKFAEKTLQMGGNEPERDLQELSE